jgi:hypothetical protein
MRKRTAAIVLALLGLVSGEQDLKIKEEHARLKLNANMNHNWIDADE